MDRSEREGRDEAGVGPYAREREQLVSMSTLDSWTVSDGDPDIRGWEVRTVSGRQLGAVSDLLIDAKAGEVVLLDVDLPGTDRHTFVPIRVVQIDRAKRVILMDSADLPNAGIAHSEKKGKAESGQRSSAGSVHYPQGDREVLVNRPVVADTAFGADDPASTEETKAQDESIQRRRSDRRRIDRMSSEI